MGGRRERRERERERERESERERERERERGGAGRAQARLLDVWRGINWVKTVKAVASLGGVRVAT